jgi:peptidylprolyl isomerase
MKNFLFLIIIAGMMGMLPRGSAEDSSPSATSAPKSKEVTFENVTVADPANMSSKPKVTSESSLPAARLKVKDLVVGSGKAANPGSTVTVKYVGVRYADGKQFDSSWERGGTAKFRLDRVIKGFTQGIGGNEDVPAMKVGGRRMMIVPSELGYGEEGTRDGSIPPNATLVFIVDLIGVD